MYCWTMWIAYSQKWRVCSLISPSIPPCHHFPSVPRTPTESSPSLRWLASFSRAFPRKSTQNNVSPPNSFQRHPLALFWEKSRSYLIHVWAEMAVMSPIIMTNVIRRAFDGLGRTIHHCVWSCIVFDSCVIFLKRFSFIFRQKDL